MPTHRLAAIMFTDIVGYTALMQSDRERAMAAVKHHEATLKDRIQAHSGELIQTYGDGSLSLFESATAAVLCAKEIQEALRGQVPLRIGIHLGEITIDGDHTFGDGVNIASRIESMGSPGTVLVSHSIWQQLKNQPSLQLSSVGKYSFKNVARPMEVYALANEGFPVPTPRSLTSTKSTPFNPTRLWIRAASVGFVAMALGAALFWALSMTSSEGKKPAELTKQSRIAVLPFENNTGKEEFKDVGNFAADWLLTQFMRLDSVEIVTLPTVQAHLDFAGSGSGNIDPSFKERTGADKLIRGKYYLQEDSLVFSCQVEDVVSGKVELAFPIVSCESSQVIRGVNELSERVLTYGHYLEQLPEESWAKLSGKRPPKFKAYQLYVESIQYFGPDYDSFLKLANEALKEDPHYFHVYLQIGYALNNLERLDETDSLLDFIHSYVEIPSRYEQLYLKDLEYRLKHDRKGVLENMDKILEIDPKHPLNNYLNALAAAQLNLPERAVKTFEMIPPQHYSTDGSDVSSWWFNVYAHNLLRVGKIEQAKYVLKFAPANSPNIGPIQMLARAYILAGEEDSISLMWRKLEEEGRGAMNLGDAANTIAYQFANYANNDSAKKYWARQALKKFEEQGQDGLEKGVSLFLLEEFEQAILYYEKVIGEELRQPWWIIAPLALMYLETGREAQFARLYESFESRRSPFWDPYYYHIQALIAAQKGKKEEAFNFIKLAYEKGLEFELGLYDDCYELRPLFDYPPFVELVRPKG